MSSWLGFIQFNQLRLIRTRLFPLLPQADQGVSAVCYAPLTIETFGVNIQRFDWTAPKIGKLRNFKSLCFYFTLSQRRQYSSGKILGFCSAEVLFLQRRLLSDAEISFAVLSLLFFSFHWATFSLFSIVLHNCHLCFYWLCLSLYSAPLHSIKRNKVLSHY